MHSITETDTVDGYRLLRGVQCPYGGTIHGSLRIIVRKAFLTYHFLKLFFIDCTLQLTVDLVLHWTNLYLSIQDHHSAKADSLSEQRPSAFYGNQIFDLLRVQWNGQHWSR